MGAHLHLAVEVTFHRWVQILQAIGLNAGYGQVGARSDGDGAGGSVDVGDVARGAVGSRRLDVEALALADGVVPRAVVFLELIALGIHDHAGAQADGTAQEGLGIAVRNEADVIGIRLGRRGEAMAFGFLADLRLRGIANREEAVIQLFLGDNTQHIGLVLVLVQGAAHVAIIVDCGVMARGHRIEAQRHPLAQ